MITRREFIKPLQLKLLKLNEADNTQDEQHIAQEKEEHIYKSMISQQVAFCYNFIQNYGLQNELEYQTLQQAVDTLQQVYQQIINIIEAQEISEASIVTIVPPLQIIQQDSSGFLYSIQPFNSEPQSLLEEHSNTMNASQEGNTLPHAISLQLQQAVQELIQSVPQVQQTLNAQQLTQQELPSHRSAQLSSQIAIPPSDQPTEEIEDELSPDQEGLAYQLNLSLSSESDQEFESSLYEQAPTLAEIENAVLSLNQQLYPASTELPLYPDSEVSSASSGDGESDSSNE